MKIRFLGAARVVTGSCYHLITDGLQILVDCGMYQGKNADEVNRQPFQFDPGQIDVLLLTHAHLDHSGLLPKLVADGFKGDIVATAGTAELVEIMLLDSAHIQERDAEWMTKKSFRAGKDQIYQPLYTEEDAKGVMPFVKKVNYMETLQLKSGVRYRFIDAGHILGSGSLEIWLNNGDEEKKIVFSGDIGKNDNPIINDPQHIDNANYVVVESTYGNRLHRGVEESIEEMVQAIKNTFKKGGNVLIPAFSVGRTQDILYILNRLVKQDRLPKLNVYVDSPLADKATKIYMAHPEYFDAEALTAFKFRSNEGMNLHFTTSIEESQKINRIKSGAIIIAGSGMCDGGRIQHHFKHNIWRPECSIIFTGFQVKGTLGRHIIDGAKSARILGEEMAIRAKTYTIGGFSAHADQKELLEWLGTITNRPKTFVTHGEESVSLEFEKVIQEKLGLETYVPHKGEELEI
ncbi:MAG TPA: MBL fold metallo-hydrolase [Syntrophorhabdaceae bacterium]|nr:MBL fold metallo-hydrolase [Syntrophorhabdaceae bacterium]MDI9561838.1 MBL fold metallo-hydrolase [Pseudomonadota bacterium]OQC52866.1 MAG: Ribonuclease [Deltaproteobacteria bacterium ADurb.Bin026]HQG50049.1 MBL fold metallo-hydrolase [Syntrophorhabdaceae bacterium]HQI57371.1 MBL fold metallo-hydrolase [Syntrophorhabdaceae bacterium]